MQGVGDTNSGFAQIAAWPPEELINYVGNRADFLFS